MKRSTFWFLFNIYGWVIFILSVVTAVLVQLWWVVLFGVIGYQAVLLVELLWGGSLGRTGRIRLARAEQENRELRDEKARLAGTIDEQREKLDRLTAGKKENPPTAPAAPTPPPSNIEEEPSESET